MNEWNVRLGERVKLARAKSGQTQAELAAAIGADRSVVANIEVGRVAVYAERVVRLADALGVDLAWLLTGRHDARTVAAAARAVEDVARLPELAEELAKQLAAVPVPRPAGEV